MELVCRRSLEEFGLAKAPECYKLTSIGDCDDYQKMWTIKIVFNRFQMGIRIFFWWGGRVDWTRSHSCYNLAKNFLTLYLGSQTW